jgi:hypothetical protein
MEVGIMMSHFLAVSGCWKLFDCYSYVCQIRVKGKAMAMETRKVVTSRFPPILDSQLTDGIVVVHLTCGLPFTCRNIPGTHFF